MVVISIIHSKERKEKPEIFKFPARWHFFLFTLSWILGILMKYLCINCIFWDSLESARPADPLRHAAGVTAPRQRQALSGASRQLPQRGSHWRVGQAHAERAKRAVSETEVPCCLDWRQLDKICLFRSCCPRKRGPPSCVLSGFQRSAQSGPVCQWLPLWGSCHACGVTERASQV